MSQSGPLSQENLPTVVAVTFLLSLIALTFCFYTFWKLNEVAVVSGAVDVGMVQRHTDAINGLEKKIAALEAQVAEAKKAAEDAKAASAAPAAGE